MIDIIRPTFLHRSLLITALTLVTLVWCAPEARAQTVAPSPQPTSTPVTGEDPPGIDAATGPIFKDYKGVQIGMTADEVRQKLGTPQVKDKTEDLFLISDDMVQVVYDQDSKVSAVSITYSSKNNAAPTALTVLGEEVAPGADGRIYKLIRYPTVGYWVAYSRTAGDTTVVSVTMKKMRVISK